MLSQEHLKRDENSEVHFDESCLFYSKPVSIALNKFIFKQWLTGSHGKIIPIDGQFKEGLRTCLFSLSKMSTGHGIT